MLCTTGSSQSFVASVSCLLVHASVRLIASFDSFGPFLLNEPEEVRVRSGKPDLGTECSRRHILGSTPPPAHQHAGQ